MSTLDPAILDPENGSVMMLGRTVKLLRQRLVPFCRYHGIPYRYFDSNSIKGTFATAIKSWIDLQAGLRVPADHVNRVYELLPAEGHGKVPGVRSGHKAAMKRLADQDEPPMLDIRQLREQHGLMADGTWDKVFVQVTPEDVKYIHSVLSKGFDILSKPNVHISTIHRVKGAEADTVVLLSDTAKASERFAENADEETRVYYTGLTRTYRDLIVVDPDRKRYYEGLYG
jgi:hypothetical protein